VSRSKVTYKMTAITPELAAAWLENRNTHNRPLRDYRIAELARDMSAGRWHDTGEPIKFDYNDALLDGQHRLGAIVASGVTIEMLVIWGLQPETQDYMDIGLKRSVADSLRDAGRRGGMVYGLSYYMLSKVDADDAEQFFRHLIDGQGLLAGSPIYALRTKLIKDPPDRASRSVRHELFYFIKAWNAYRRNQSIVVLRWARGEDYPEAV
jgi:hypothetical protein